MSEPNAEQRINPRTAYIQGTLGAFVSSACASVNQAAQIAHAAGPTVPDDIRDRLDKALHALMEIPVFMDRVK